ncbi:hypothetical protein Tco_0988294 [Tanacetum coccineum]|uniref:Uncharacterized protein n=1 Tax=Tanacetum coccineum TaxID=301880 RepID=A0ABQ5EQQ2_9ASTR
MRITSSHRLFGLPGSLTLWVILPKNLHKRNNFVSHDSLLPIQNGFRFLGTMHIRLNLSKRIDGDMTMDDNGIPSKSYMKSSLKCDKLRWKCQTIRNLSNTFQNLKRTDESRTELALDPKSFNSSEWRKLSETLPDLLPWKTIWSRDAYQA